MTRKTNRAFLRPCRKTLLRALAGALLLPLIAALLTGCLGAREINDMAIISGAAFDRDEKTGLYQVSAEIVNKNASMSEGGSETEKIQATGLTIADSIQNCGFTDSRKAYWSHARVFVVSRELAEQQGIGPLLDYVIRNYKARLSIDLLVSGLDDAGSVLDLSTASTNIKAFDLEEMLKTDLRSAGAAPLKVYQAIDLLHAPGVELTIPIVTEQTVNHADDSSSKEGGGGNSGGDSGSGGGDSSGSGDSGGGHDRMALISGTAAFRGDKMIGTLSPDETVPLLFLQDRMEEGHLAYPQKQLSVDIKKSSTKLIPKLTAEGLSLTAQIRVNASVSQFQGGTLATEEQREKAAAQIGAAISEDCTRLIKRVQSQLKSDVFGFGKAIREQKPSLWDRYGTNWNTEGFPKLHTEVDVEVYLDPGETTAGQIMEGRW